VKKLYFIRHGQSEFNVRGLFAGRTETPLTEDGRAQAKRTGKVAKTKGLQVDLIISSPLSRALETAQIVAREINYPLNKIVISEQMIERDFGEGEGTPWIADPRKRNFKGMETDDELVVRARKALDWIEELPADSIVVVSHGSIGRALRSLVKEDFPMSHPHKLSNAELYEWL
jgi:broad specificity phosphatase PhoE